MVKHI